MADPTRGRGEPQQNVLQEILDTRKKGGIFFPKLEQIKEAQALAAGIEDPAERAEVEGFLARFEAKCKLDLDVILKKIDIMDRNPDSFLNPKDIEFLQENFIEVPGEQRERVSAALEKSIAHQEQKEQDRQAEIGRYEGLLGRLVRQMAVAEAGSTGVTLVDAGAPFTDAEKAILLKHGQDFGSSLRQLTSDEVMFLNTGRIREFHNDPNPTIAVDVNRGRAAAARIDKEKPTQIFEALQVSPKSPSLGERLKSFLGIGKSADKEKK